MSQLVGPPPWPFLLTIAVSCGIALTVAFGVPGIPIRAAARKIHPLLGKLVTCPMCLSFWIGLVIAYLGLIVEGRQVLFSIFVGFACTFIASVFLPGSGE